MPTVYPIVSVTRSSDASPGLVQRLPGTSPAISPRWDAWSTAIGPVLSAISDLNSSVRIRS